jgi:2'-5' RNA ligase
MHEQLYLPGTPRPLARTDHLFLALFPDDSVTRQISQLAKELRARLGLGDHQLAADRFHVSLYSLGTYSGVPEIVVRAASQAAVVVAASMAPFKVKFDRAGSFAGSRHHRPFVLRAGGDNAALAKFHGRLGAELGKRGFPCNPNSRFTPHTTLLYSKQSAAEESVNAVSWTVSEFVLVHSLLGKTQYIPLARWMLQGQAGRG